MVLPNNIGPNKNVANRSEAWPFYIVCDVSESMYSERFSSDWGNATSPWQLMNMELGQIIDELEEEAEASHIAHIAVVEFSNEATSVSKLAVVASRPTIRRLSQGTWTNYVGAWEFLASLVPADVRRLRAVGREVRRPIIFFITDGNPGSERTSQGRADWQPHIDSMSRELGPITPRIVAIGLGDVNHSNILGLHSGDPHGAAVIASRNGGTSTLIQPLVEQIKKSILNSAVSGRFTWAPPAGMTSLCDEERH